MNRKALILDLDDTLYNWTDAYVLAMQAQINYLTHEIDRKESTIFKYFKTVFKKYNSVEIPNGVRELDVWARLSLSKKQQNIVIEKAWNTFITEFGKQLCLYPNVKETLEWAQNNGFYIFGLTNTFAHWVNWRLEHLGIIQYFDKIYALNDDCLTSRSFINNTYQSKNIILMNINELKPSPIVIEHIITNYDLQKQNVFLVGDSLSNDINAAQSGGICDIWAKYGTRHKAGCGRILGAITPWTKKDRELRAYAKNNIEPTFSIENFGELKAIITN